MELAIEIVLFSWAKGKMTRLVLGDRPNRVVTAHQGAEEVVGICLMTTAYMSIS